MRNSGILEDANASTTKRPWITFVLLLAACFIDGADVQLLPACFRALEAELGFTPVHLGYLAMTQGLFMATFAPFWGSIADTGMVPKRVLLSTAVAGWGIFTIILSTASNFYSVLLLRIPIGACLASIMPLSQTIIARQAGPQERGRLFGWVQFSWLLGQATSALCATSISTSTFWLSGTRVLGWRLAFLAVGFMSLGLSMIIALLLDEPQQSLNPRFEGTSVGEVFQDVAQRARPYFKIPTFRIIVIQGLFGTIPWSALNFTPMFLQYIGFEDHQAAMLVTIGMVGMGPGNLIGGYIGDWAAQFSKYHGRIVVAQISILFGIPLMVIMFRVVTPAVTSLTAYACVAFTHGILGTWVMAGVKRPILSEIVRPGDWASLLALDTAFEGASGAMFGAPLVGLLAQHAFGYTPVTGQVRDLLPVLRHRNMRALQNGLCCITVVPWVICWLFWTFLHFTYPADLKSIEGDETEDDVLVPDVKEDAPLLSLRDDGCTTSAY